MTRRAAILAAAVTLAGLVAGGLAVRHLGRPAVESLAEVRLAGDAVPTPVTRDMDAGEAGPVAGREFTSARQQHLRNREAYRGVPMRDAPRDRREAEARVAVLLDGALRDAPADRRAVRRAGAGAEPALAEALAAVHLAASGATFEQYRDLLPDGARIDADAAQTQLDRVFDQFGRRPDAATPEARFRAAYDLNRAHRGGASNAAAWPADGEGFRLAAGWAGFGDPYPEIYRDFDPADAGRLAGLWYGSLAQGGVVVTAGPRDPADALADGPQLIVHAAMIVRTADDWFPIDVTLWYDGESQAWYPLAVTRRSSVRLASAPPLVL